MLNSRANDYFSAAIAALHYFFAAAAAILASENAAIPQLLQL